MKKHVHIFMCMLLLWGNANAQFLQSLGDQNAQYGKSVQTTPVDQGYIVAGYSSPGPLGLTDANLVKTDQNGTVLWTNMYGGQNNDQFNSVRNVGPGASGTSLAYVAAGFTNSYGSGGNDMYLVGVDQFGTSLFARTYGGSKSDKAYCVQKIVDVNGQPGFIIVGETSSFTLLPKKNIYVVRTDLFGNLTNAVVLGTPGDDIGYWIEQTSDRGYVITGSTTQRCTSDTTDNNNVYVAKLDPNLNVQWNRIFAGPKSRAEVGFCVRENTNNQTYIVTGNTLSYGNGTESFLLNLDLAGNFLWFKLYGGSKVESGQNVLVTKDLTGAPQYIVTGYSNSFNATFNYDALTFKTDLAGTLVWSKTYGGTGHEYSYEIDHNQFTGLGYVFAGRTPSFGAGSIDHLLIETDNFGRSASACEKDPVQKQRKFTPCYTSNTQYVYVDIFKQVPFPFVRADFKIDKCSTPSRMSALIPEEEAEPSFMNLAPVPASSVLNVTFRERCSGSVLNVINAQGNLINSYQVNAEDMHVEVSNLPTGIYYLQLIRKDGKKESTRFVKE